MPDETEERPSTTSTGAEALAAAAVPSIQVAHVSAAPPDEVYAIASRPALLPRWAHGLAATAPRAHADGAIEIDSPAGVVTVELVPRNDLGVLDHVVTLPGGARVLNPMRVVAHPRGSEILFTVRRTPGTSAAEHEADAAAVLADLKQLAALAEDGLRPVPRRGDVGPGGGRVK